MLEFDLHIHSKFSFDSKSEPARIIETAVKRGLRGIAVTDHNNIEGSLETIKLAPKELIVVPGVEITTESGDILAFFVSDQPPDTKNPFEVVDWIRSKNGIAVMAHPFAYRLSIDAKVIKIMDGIEAFNARHPSAKASLPKSGMGPPISDDLTDFANANGLSMTGGSDAHYISEIGNGRTIMPASCLDEVRMCIKNRNTAVRGKPQSLLQRISVSINTAADKLFR